MADADLAAEVIAMQFAAGRAIAQLAEEWDREPGWVEEAVRRALLERIPVRDGGLKPARAHISLAESEERAAAHEAQRLLELG